MKKYIKGILSFFVIGVCILNIAHAKVQNDGEDPTKIVYEFLETLSKICENSQDAKLQNRLKSFTQRNCTVFDIVADYYNESLGIPKIIDVNIDSYITQFTNWAKEGKISLTFSDIHWLKKWKLPQMNNSLKEDFVFVSARITIRGVVNMDLENIFRISDGKIFNILDISDKDENSVSAPNVGKAIYLYNKGKKYHKAAFNIFRNIALETTQNYLAKYCTAIMELKGEGCKDFDKKFRKVEAVKLLTYGFYRAVDCIREAKEREILCKNESLFDYYNEYKKYFILETTTDALRVVGAIKSLDDMYRISWLLWVTYINDDIPYMLGDYHRNTIEKYELLSEQLTQRPSCYDLTLIRSLKNNKWYYGFMNKKGKEFISCKYLWGSSFDKSTGLALVLNQEGKWGYIDTLGNEIIPFEYVSACDKWVNGKTVVFKDSRLYVIDINNTILREISDYIRYDSRTDNYIFVLNNKGKGTLIDFNGDIAEKQGEFLENLDNKVTFQVAKDRSTFLHFYKDGKEVFKDELLFY